MSLNPPHRISEAQIAAACNDFLRDHPDCSVLPAEALRQAAINRLLARARQTPMVHPTMLTSNRVSEDNEESESDRGVAPSEAVPDPESAWEDSLTVPPPDTALRIPAYVRGALAYALDAEIGGRIPEHQRTFLFVRVLKAHPDIVRMTTGKVWNLTLKHAPAICDATTPEDAEAAFYDAWDSVRLPFGAQPLAEAFRRATSLRLGLLPDAGERPQGYQTFISLAGWLCVVAVSDKIKLPVEAIADLLGVTPMTVSRYRKFAIKDGYLVKLKEHRWRRDGSGEATTFKFQVGLWKVLRAEMPPTWQPAGG